MKVVIISSLSKESAIRYCESYFTRIGAEVITPLDDQTGSLFDIQRKYLDHIGEADLVVAIPKDVVRPGADTVDGYKECLQFGESTSYEIAIASFLGKAIVYWAH